MTRWVWLLAAIALLIVAFLAGAAVVKPNKERIEWRGRTELADERNGTPESKQPWLPRDGTMGAVRTTGWQSQ